MANISNSNSFDLHRVTVPGFNILCPYVHNTDKNSGYPGRHLLLQLNKNAKPDVNGYEVKFAKKINMTWADFV